MDKLSPNEYRRQILERFPWILERDRHMILSTDLDGILCGIYMHHFFGWKIAGFYDLERICISQQVQLQDAIWLDLDISHPQIYSVGHHILTLKPSEPLSLPPMLEKCLNPNIERMISRKEFQRKYPFATIHLLIWLHSDSINGQLDDFQKMLLYFADSSWINAQRYNKNCRDWVENFIDLPLLVEMVEQAPTVEFEHRAEQFVKILEDTGIRRGRGQVTSQFLGIGGYQVRFTIPPNNPEDLQNKMSSLARIMGWKSEITIPLEYRVIFGKRISDYINNPKFENIIQYKPFSYAITNRNQINYTIIETKNIHLT